MTEVFSERAGKYINKLKKPFLWVEDEGVARPLVSGDELAVRGGFLLKRVTGVSKLQITETAPGFEQPERFPDGFTPDPPVPNASTGLYDGWMIVGDTKASMEADPSGIYDGLPEMARAFNYYLQNAIGPDGRPRYRFRNRKWNIPDGLYRYNDGRFLPQSEPDANIPRTLEGIRTYCEANNCEGVVFEHESGAVGQVLAAKIPEPKPEPEPEPEKKKPGRPRKAPEPEPALT